MRKALVLLLLTVASLTFGWAISRPEAQQPFILQLANGASSGSGLETARSATLSNFTVSSTLTSRNVAGAQLISFPSRWSVVSFPAASSQGTASIAAEAGVRHVADCVIWAADSSGAVTAAAGNLALRDGATGAGTIIMQIAVPHAVAAGAGIATIPANRVCGLNLVGTTNTAMTAEFNAGVTNEVQSVTLTGYNIN